MVLESSKWNRYFHIIVLLFFFFFFFFFSFILCHSVSCYIINPCIPASIIFEDCLSIFMSSSFSACDNILVTGILLNGNF